jgi:cobalt-zinc-cadmium efflux system protein
VATFIGDQPGVTNVHDLHIWALSTTRTALAAHVVWEGADADAFLEHLTDELEHDFGIGHVTRSWSPHPANAPVPALQPDARP